MLVFIGLCVGAWLTADNFPPSTARPWALVGVIAAMIAWIMTSWLYLQAGSIFMLCYLPPLAIMLPQEWLTKYFGLISILMIVRLVPNYMHLEYWIAGFIVLAVMTNIAIRINREHTNRETRLNNATLLQRTTEEQRLALAADLHDVLGQLLTAISMKAALVENLLDGEGAASQTAAHQAAVREAADIHRLSREALADVRRVVAGTRETTFDQELVAAKLLLGALDTNIDVIVNWNCERDKIPAASAIGRFGPYVIREACTNIARHSYHVSTVTIDIDTDRVCVWDNGTVDGFAGADEGATTESASAADKAMASTPSWGLRGLASRVGHFGTVTWGPSKTVPGWHVTLTANQNANATPTHVSPSNLAQTAPATSMAPLPTTGGAQ